MNVGSNEYAFLVRKSVSIQAGQYGIAVVDIRVRVPAGAASYDAANIKALMSSLGGFISNQAQGMTDTITQGIL